MMTYVNLLEHMETRSATEGYRDALESFPNCAGGNSRHEHSDAGGPTSADIHESPFVSKSVFSMTTCQATHELVDHLFKPLDRDIESRFGGKRRM